MKAYYISGSHTEVRRGCAFPKEPLLTYSKGLLCMLNTGGVLFFEKEICCTNQPNYSSSMTGWGLKDGLLAAERTLMRYSLEKRGRLFCVKTWITCSSKESSFCTQQGEQNCIFVLILKYWPVHYGMYLMWLPTGFTERWLGVQFPGWCLGAYLVFYMTVLQKHLLSTLTNYFRLRDQTKPPVHSNYYFPSL